MGLSVRVRPGVQIKDMNDKTINYRSAIIFTRVETYPDGSNTLFSIKLGDQQTGWYNDNHDFGDEDAAIVAAKKIADYMIDVWYDYDAILGDMDRSKFVEFVFSCTTDEWKKYDSDTYT